MKWRELSKMLKMEQVLNFRDLNKERSGCCLSTAANFRNENKRDTDNSWTQRADILKQMDSNEHY